MKLTTLKPLLNIKYIYIIVVFIFASCKSNHSNNLLKNNITSQIDIIINDCGVIAGNEKAKIGDNIDKWKDILGYNYSRNLVSYGLPLQVSTDSVFVWNELGITIASETDYEGNWTVKDVYFFLSIPSKENKELMFFEYIEEKAKLYYKNNLNHIEDFAEINDPWVDEERKKKDRVFLKKLQEYNSNITKYIYPKTPFKGNLIFEGTVLNKNLTLQEINENSKPKSLPLIGFETKVFFPLDEDEMKIASYITNHEYKNDPNYLKTNISVKGLYGLISNSKTTTKNIMVNNGKIEFVQISKKTCNKIGSLD